MKRIFPNNAYCIGCKLCELACITVNSQSNDLVVAYKEECIKGLVSSIQVVKHEDTCVALSCRHCEEPSCAAACAFGALSRDTETGVTVYDAEKCTGCWSCLMACPYGAIQRNKLKNEIVKCHLCIGRTEGPACVQACPNRSLKYEERSLSIKDSDIRLDGCSVVDSSFLHNKKNPVTIIAGCDAIDYDYADLNLRFKINEISTHIKRAVVVGSGPVGVKLSETLYELGVEVAIVDDSCRILHDYCDEQASALISRRINDAGLLITLGITVGDVLRDKDGGVKGVLLSDRSFLEAEAVFFTNGVNAGDCHSKKFVSEETDREKNEGLENIPMNSISFCGLPVISVGNIDPADDNFKYESYFYCDEDKQIYRRLVFKGNQLVGYILVGDIDLAGILTSLVKFQLEIGADSKKLISEGKANLLMWPDGVFDNVWNPEKAR